MSIEKIREILATKGMDWIWNEFEGIEMWGTPSRGGIKLECWLDKWKPDENPEQMMDVVNMMREKGWRCRINDAYYPIINAYWYFPGDPFRHYNGKADTECKARMIAAYRALEDTDAC